MAQVLSRSVEALKRSVRDPLPSFRHLVAFLRGLFYILYFRRFRPNVKIRFPFFAFTSVKIMGPGSVAIGKNCYVHKNVYKGLIIVTHCRASSVEIGDGCLLGGVTIRCRKHIQIGDGTMTAISLVQDSFFLDQNKTDVLIAKGAIPPLKSVVIKENVWLGAGSIVMSGSYIGKDSVLSAGAGCYGDEVDDYCLVIGNPGKKPLPIERLLRLKGHV